MKKNLVKKAIVGLLTCALFFGTVACNFQNGDASSVSQSSASVGQSDTGENSEVSSEGSDEGSSEGSSEGRGEGENTIPVMTVTQFEAPVWLVNEAVKEFYSASADTLLRTILLNYAQPNKDRAEGVTIGYTISDLPIDTAVSEAVVSVYERGESQAWKTVNFASGKNTITIYNMKTGMPYDFSITATLSNGDVLTENGSFETAESVRLMNLDDIHNVRDIGGRLTEDGRKIKQGLFYRGTELDGAVEPKYYNLSASGIKEMTETLGIKMEIDLRSKKTNMRSVLGENVKHLYYDMSYYSSVIVNGGGQAKVKAVFDELAKPENYPVYLHCTYGMDRTGTVCFILGALLGMSELDLIRDYELTKLCDVLAGSNGWRDRTDTEFNKYLVSFKALQGETMQQKAINYLLNIGITQSQIDTILALFLEDAVRV